MSVVPSATRLVSMEDDGAPSTPPASVSAPFTGIQSYGYTDQRKVEADVEVTEDRTGDLLLRKPCTSQLSQLSHDFAPFAIFYFTKLKETSKFSSLLCHLSLNKLFLV